MFHVMKRYGIEVIIGSFYAQKRTASWNLVPDPRSWKVKFRYLFFTGIEDYFIVYWLTREPLQKIHCSLGFCQCWFLYPCFCASIHKCSWSEAISKQEVVSLSLCRMWKLFLSARFVLMMMFSLKLPWSQSAAMALKVAVERNSSEVKTIYGNFGSFHGIFSN